MTKVLLLNIILITLIFTVHSNLQSQKRLIMLDSQQSLATLSDVKDIHATTTYASLEQLAADTLINISKIYKQVPASHQALVVMDIDDTALVKIPQSKNLKNRQSEKTYVAIKPIHILYEQLLKLTIKIAFVTWRVETPAHRKATEDNLKSCGYSHYDSLHMRPRSWNLSRSAFKESVRRMLAKSFTILATVDDKLDNLMGECTGDYIVWINQ